MDVGAEQVRRYRLRGHHLDRKLPPEDLLVVAGACGVQNSPLVEEAVRTCLAGRMIRSKEALDQAHAAFRKLELTAFCLNEET